jgi:outer membrane protein assembly factor BamE (lipoprotein component of BamABCDE complex)
MTRTLQMPCPSRLAGTLLACAIALGLPACDFVAQKELKSGESTADDVRRLMGKPDMIWEEKDGAQVLEFARGHETMRVSIAPDGKYQSMQNILTRENFAKVALGMSQDQVRQLLGKPAEVVEFKLKDETVWSYRHMSDPGRVQMFNAHFRPDGTIVNTTTTEDPASGRG